MAGGRKWAFWRRPGSEAADAASYEPRRAAASRRNGPRAVKWLPYLVIWPVVGVFGIAIYARHFHSGSVFAVALLVAGASFLVGSLFGLLFGIPRWLASDAPAPPAAPQAVDGSGPGSSDRAARGRYTPNTNLEQISDWLTKALVGVGLVELKGLGSAMRRLANDLAPGVGGQDSSPVFAGAVVVGYAVTGFILAYLVTRIYLGRAFAEADDLTERLDKVEEIQQEQQKNLAALNLITRYLDADQGDSSITQDQLDAAVTAASDLVRIQIFNMARQRRQQQRSPAQQKRAAGVFRALIASDTDGLWHRNHAQLGYALHALSDFAGAEDAFTTAIQRRDARGQRGFDLYELMRAVSRIALDQANAPAGAGPSDPQVVDEILVDLRKAARSRSLRTDIANKVDGSDPRVRDWAVRNNLTVADLTQAPAPPPQAPVTPPDENPAQPPDQD